MIHKKKIAFILSLLWVIPLLSGCSANLNTESQASYKVISAKEAKALMDEQSNYIILDVRTEEEFAQGHIPNAMLIPDYELQEKAETQLPDKNQLIFVYCRSGRRSAVSAKQLLSLGYTNIIDFGGIIDWPYEIDS